MLINSTNPAPVGIKLRSRSWGNYNISEEIVHEQTEPNQTPGTGGLLDKPAPTDSPLFTGGFSEDIVLIFGTYNVYGLGKMVELTSFESAPLVINKADQPLPCV